MALALTNEQYAVHADGAIQRVLKLPPIYQELGDISEAPIDSSIYQNIQKLVAHGWYTVNSCSGMVADHPKGRAKTEDGQDLEAHLVLYSHPANDVCLREAGFRIFRPFPTCPARQAIVGISVGRRGASDHALKVAWQRLTDFLLSKPPLKLNVVDRA